MLKTEVDPFTIEIIRSGITATTDEMKTNLMRTAYNSIVYESQDFTVALTDRHGNLASIGLGLPSFIRGISDTVKAMLKHFGDDIHPGDVLMTNDSQYHGSHLNHMIMALPVFVDGEIVAFSCSEPHWADVGGLLGAPATDLYAEGLCLPPVKIYERGELNQEIVDIIKMNVRNPDLAMGDFRGQVACCRTGEKRVVHLATKYGKEAFIRAIEIIMDKSEEFSRKQLLKVPDGTYEAEQFLDDDGIDVGQRMVIKVKITKKGDTMTVDLSDVGKQVRGPFNSGAGVSGAQMGFKTLFCPLERPVNDGSFRPLKVVTKPGTFVTAVRPAALRMWMIPPMNIADTMWHAMAEAMPDQIAAGHFGTLGGATAGAMPIDPKTGRQVALRRALGGGGGGGWGAKYNEDGNCATYCLNDGDTHNTPIEAGEAQNIGRALVVRMELRQDTAGAGKFRGGVGSLTEALYFTDSVLNSFIERCTSPPWGAFGAKSGAPNGLRVGIPTRKPTEDEVRSPKLLSLELDYETIPNAKHPNGKTANKLIPAGSRVAGFSGGGGGYGDPLERDPAKVLEDVINGYVSLKAAERDYGVAIDPATMKIQSERTDSLRKKPGAQSGR